MDADRVKDKEEATREMTQLDICRVNVVAFNVPEGNSEDIETDGNTTGNQSSKYATT